MAIFSQFNHALMQYERHAVVYVLEAWCGLCRYDGIGKAYSSPSLQ